MDARDFRVKLSVLQTEEIIRRGVEGSAATAELVDEYRSDNGRGETIVFMTFEKYFMRNSSRATLAVCIDNLKGYTHVHASGSGGGQNVLFRFDWGAGGNLVGTVEDALKQYLY